MKLYFPKKLIGRLALSIWLVACVAVLVFAFIQREIRDTDIAFAYFMLFLTFPIGYILTIPIGFIFMGLYNLYGMVVPGGFLPNLTTWIILVAAGYLQWVVLIPWLYRRLRKTSRKIHLTKRPSGDFPNR